MKRVLVTAAGGFVGRHCLAPLIARGYDVHGVSRRARHADIAEPITWHAADLLDDAATEAVVDRVQPTHLLHLAWVTTHGDYWHSEANTHWLAASLVLVRAVVRAGAGRIVAVGTCAEYDWTHGPCIEHVTPARPTTRYGQTKDELRGLIEAASDEHGFAFAWARLFYLFGPHEQPQRLVPTIITRLHRRQAVALGSGEARRDYLYVKDAGEALAAVVDSAVTGAVNIASGAATPIRTIAEHIAHRYDAADLLRFGALPDRDGEPDEIVADVTRLRDAVGFSPRYALDAALDETIRHFAGRRS